MTEFNDNFEFIFKDYKIDDELFALYHSGIGSVVVFTLGKNGVDQSIELSPERMLKIHKLFLSLKMKADPKTGTVEDFIVGDGVEGVFYPERRTVRLQTYSNGEMEMEIHLDEEMVYAIALKMGIIKNGKAVP